MSDIGERVASVVPSVYYDLIARVLPGAATIAGVMWASRATPLNLTSVTGLGEASLLLAVAGAAYVVGLLITPLGSFLCELPLRILGSRVPSVRDFSSQVLWKRIRKVEQADPAFGATLAKMAAEVTLCQNLVAAVVVMWVIPGGRLSALQALAAIGVCAVSAAFRAFMLAQRLRDA
jgi:hypothetical protein